MQTFADKQNTPDSNKSKDFQGHDRAEVQQSPAIHPILRLQRTIGNHAVQRLIQFKLENPEGGSPGDEYEKNADWVADQMAGQEFAEEENDQGSVIQVKASQQSTNAAPGQGKEPEDQIHSVTYGGSPLSPGIRSRFEPRFGRDFGRVRIHTDERAAESARLVGARAFTMGSDIVFGKSQYSPETPTGRHLLAHELTHVVQQSGQTSSEGIQRKPDKDSDDTKVTTGELAWEIFSPVAAGGVRSLAPGVLKSTKVGQNYEEVIEIVDKLEGSIKKITDYEKKIKEMTKGKAGGGHKFALKSMGKVNKHFQSIPDAIDIEGEKLINEASAIVTSDMFTNMADAVTRLQNFVALVKQTKRLRYPYGRMVSRLTEAETRINASFEALGVLEDALLDLAKYAILPVYQAELFSQSMTVRSYRSDVGTVLSTVRNKRKGYEKAIAASEEMEAYMKGKAGRKGIEENYKEPKDAGCLSRVLAALPALKKSPDAIYQTILPYSECTFENILDALDFLPIEDSDGFFAVTTGLRDAYPDRVSEINQKENRYVAGVTLYVKLLELRPRLRAIETILDPMIMPFIYQEYYRFFVEDPRSLLSNYKFTYIHQIKQMTRNVDMLMAAVLISSYFETR